MILVVITATLGEAGKAWRILIDPTHSFNSYPVVPCFVRAPSRGFDLSTSLRQKIVRDNSERMVSLLGGNAKKKKLVPTTHYLLFSL